MNHYPHHIGDFNNATRHLTRVERSLYRDMLDLYYDTEQPLNGDTNKLARRLLASSEEEQAAMLVVLDEFFDLKESGWHNARCDAEIAKYRGQIEQASKAGRASAAKRSEKKATQENGRSNLDEHKSNARSTPVALPLNQPEPEPTYSIPNGMGGEPPALTNDEIIFGYGVPLLVNAGTPEKQARSFLGMQRKRSEKGLIDALRDCLKVKPLQPMEWLAAALPPPTGKAAAGKHSGFQSIDYREGIAADGSFA